ncbi:MAG: response regulator [Deltaproteobacteria bacterium]|nr:response regulator [Deltaproteobacteria bacterium]
MAVVLIIDDEEDIRTIATLALEDVGGFEVVTAANCAEGLQAAAKHRPDVILLDVMMPDVNGLVTFDRLQNLPETRETPIIFMTARVQRDEVAELQATDAKGVIAKPFDPMTLADEVTELTGVRP